MIIVITLCLRQSQNDNEDKNDLALLENCPLLVRHLF